MCFTRNVITTHLTTFSVLVAQVGLSRPGQVTSKECKSHNYQNRNTFPGQNCSSRTLDVTSNSVLLAQVDFSSWTCIFMVWLTSRVDTHAEFSLSELVEDVKVTSMNDVVWYNMFTHFIPRYSKIHRTWRQIYDFLLVNFKTYTNTPHTHQTTLRKRILDTNDTTVFHAVSFESMHQKPKTHPSISKNTIKTFDVIFVFSRCDFDKHAPSAINMFTTFQKMTSLNRWQKLHISCCSFESMHQTPNAIIQNYSKQDQQQCGKQNESSLSYFTEHTHNNETSRTIQQGSDAEGQMPSVEARAVQPARLQWHDVGWSSFVSTVFRNVVGLLLMCFMIPSEWREHGDSRYGHKLRSGTVSLPCRKNTGCLHVPKRTK